MILEACGLPSFDARSLEAFTHGFGWLRLSPAVTGLAGFRGIPS